MKNVCLCAIALAFGFIACTQDAYDKGEGKYSYLRADFVEAHADASKQIDYFTTDEGDRLTTSQPATAKWVTKGDSIYRCLIYYNKVKGDDGKPKADIVTFGQVPCPRVIRADEFEGDIMTDPVRFESAWMSKSGHYLNLGFYLMTGTTDDKEAVQTISVIADTLMTNADDSKTLHLRLHHNQGGIPEYYSTQVYASIPTAYMKADSVRIAINTYQGEVVKAFCLAE